MLLTLAIALTLSKDPGTADLFKDKGDLYIKAGTRQGLKVGDDLKVLAGDKEVGSATVMEVFESLARVAVDDEAQKHPEAKKVRLGGKAPADAQADTAKSDDASAGSSGSLKGRATIIGLGPAKQITVYNKGDKAWTNCDLRLPTNKHYALASLRAADQERIFLHMFKQDGVELDRPLDVITVKCDQGTSRFLFDL